MRGVEGRVCGRAATTHVHDVHFRTHSIRRSFGPGSIRLGSDCFTLKRRNGLRKAGCKAPALRRAAASGYVIGDQSHCSTSSLFFELNRNSRHASSVYDLSIHRLRRMDSTLNVADTLLASVPSCHKSSRHSKGDLTAAKSTCYFISVDSGRNAPRTSTLQSQNTLSTLQAITTNNTHKAHNTSQTFK